MESSDVYMEIEPGTGGIKIHLESVVQQQFGPVKEVMLAMTVSGSSLK